MADSWRLTEIVAQLGGQLLGDADASISQVATLEAAQAHHISFLANSKYRTQLSGTRAGAVILGQADADATRIPRIVSSNPYAYFAKVSALLNPMPKIEPGVHPDAVVSRSAQVDVTASIAATAVIADGAKIGAFSIIGEGCSIGANVLIGSHARLYPRVVIYQGCVLGDNFIAHSGVVIGADGFGMAMDEGCWIKVPQIGRVLIGNDVEIGANTTIDRGTLDDTVIEDGVKLDNQIQIAHNVRIGAYSAIAGCVGIAGSTEIGKYCRLGGGSAILGHLKLADHVDIGAYTLISKSILEAGSYTGIFPFDKTEAWRKNAVHVRHLDKLVERIRILEQQVSSLKGKI